jgi:hypothetical protein
VKGLRCHLLRQEGPRSSLLDAAASGQVLAVGSTIDLVNRIETEIPTGNRIYLRPRSCLLCQAPCRGSRTTSTGR